MARKWRLDKPTDDRLDNGAYFLDLFLSCWVGTDEELKFISIDPRGVPKILPLVVFQCPKVPRSHGPARLEAGIMGLGLLAQHLTSVRGTAGRDLAFW